MGPYTQLQTHGTTHPHTQTCPWGSGVKQRMRCTKILANQIVCLVVVWPVVVCLVLFFVFVVHGHANTSTHNDTLDGEVSTPIIFHCFFVYRVHVFWIFHKIINQLTRFSRIPIFYLKPLCALKQSGCIVLALLEGGVPEILYMLTHRILHSLNDPTMAHPMSTPTLYSFFGHIQSIKTPVLRTHLHHERVWRM